MTPYQKIRAAGKQMTGKVLDATRHVDFHMLRIARRMTLPTSGRTLIFGGEADQNAFLDFMFHEYRVDRKSLVEHVDPQAAGLEPLEAEVLDAHRRAQTTFLASVRIMPHEHQILMRDLLEPDRPEVLLTDIGLSGSLHRMGLELHLFCRLVVVRGITMTSGFSFGFNPEHTPGILQAYRQKTKKVPPEDLSEARFVFFFKKHRQLGVDQQYRDVF